MQVRQFHVQPNIPDRLAPLHEIAHNMWVSWNWEAVQLFMRLDPDYWQKSYQNPAKMLGMLPQQCFDDAVKDDSFLSWMDRVYEDFRRYLSMQTWWQEAHGDKSDCRIAYFSMEYGIDEGLPIYSGGLGMLSGDHLKSASDLGLPLVAVGLMYRQGYFKQYLNVDGWQQESYPENDWYNMPVTPECDKKGQPLQIQVDMAGTPVFAHIWRVQVGRVPLYLLDTNIEANAPEHRVITAQLYGGDREIRIRQEILLGIGGVRALRALGIRPSVCHMNEGHSAFLALERIRELMEEDSLAYPEAREIVWATNVFTTHTPVPAGIDRFPSWLMDRYFSEFVRRLGISRDEFLWLGCENPSDSQDQFCMAVLALRLAAHCNGVSRLHGAVSRRMWRNLWPGVPMHEVPITAVTNGIHTRSWLSHDMAGLFDLYLGPRFVDEPLAFDVWARVSQIPDAELWRTHERRRERLVAFARRRLRAQLERRGAPPSETTAADEILDPEALTIGFARRFATYKRALLLLRDPERLLRLLTDAERPVQLIFAGKAHPQDQPGKQLIREIVHFGRNPAYRNYIVFIEDYDINVARYMLQGVDVWLNTPRRPLEASGTSGMKAAANGAINLSVLDGWWAEGYTRDTGWAIGRGEEYADVNLQDQIEGLALYNILEQEVVPLFYDRGRDGLPRGWLARMKASMTALGPVYNTHRMVHDYTKRFYVPGYEKWRTFTGDHHEQAKELARWRARIDQNWGQVRVEEIATNTDGALRVGDELAVSARVFLGGLSPDEVSVEMYHGMLDSQGRLERGSPVALALEKPLDNGRSLFSGKASCDHSGRHGLAVRVLPKHADLVHAFLPGKIVWA